MTGTSGAKALLAAIAALAFVATPVAALGIPSSPAPLGDPTPYAPNAVRATYGTRILASLDGFQIGVDLDVFELDLPPVGGRTATELRAAPDAVREVFEGFARDAIQAEATRVLPETRVTLESFDVDYGFEDGDADPFHPPVRVQAQIRADFLPTFFGLPPTTQTSGGDLARAFLYSGGVYTVSKDLPVPAGYDVRHVVNVPSFLALREQGALPTDRLTFRSDNFQGIEAGQVHLDFMLSLRLDAIPANVLAGPVVQARFVVDDATPQWKQMVPLMGGEYVGTLDLDIQVHSLDSKLFGAYPLPRQVQLDHVSADLLRVALRENLVLRQDVETFFDGLIRRSLEEGFGPDIDLRMDWTAFDRALNEPIGGNDGTTVAPLTVRAHAVLPFESNKMFVSSSLGRLFGMTVGSRGSFDLTNDGMWNAEYTVAYPKDVHVKVSDSAGFVRDENWGEREGFTVALDRGAKTHVTVTGRSDFAAPVFVVGLLELALVAAAVWALQRKVRELMARGFRGGIA